jgi:hypothetical protein
MPHPLLARDNLTLQDLQKSSSLGSEEINGFNGWIPTRTRRSLLKILFKYMQNLPPIIPRASGMSSVASRPSMGSIGRAQQVNISKLNQLKEREAATTSIAGAIRKKEGLEDSGPTTSVNRTNNNAPASTSVFHPGVSSGVSDESDAVRDRLRFQNIRKIMREKKETADNMARDAEKTTGLDVNTGSAFRTSGVNSIKKTLGRMYRQNRSEYKSLTKDDKALLQRVIQDKAAVKRTGSDFTYKDKKQMRQEIYKNFKSGTINKETYKHFKGVIEDVS